MPDQPFRKMLCVAVPRFWTKQGVVAPVVGALYIMRQPDPSSQWRQFWRAETEEKGSPTFLVAERYVADAFSEEHEPELEVAASESPFAETQFHAYGALFRYLDSLPQETVDGVKVKDAADMVLLEEAYSPVLMEPHTEQEQGIPRPCPVSKTEGDTFIVYAQAGAQIVSAEELKVMRARLLLWHGYLYKLMAQGRLLPHPKPEQYVAWYHGGSLHIPQILIDHSQQETEGAIHA